MTKNTKKVVNVPKPKKVKFKIDGLPDAIVDGNLIVPVGDRILVSQEIEGKKILCVYLIKSLREDGLVSAWDETTVRWRSFKLTDPIIAKIMPEGSVL